MKENETADLRLRPGTVLLSEVSVRSEGGVERTDLLSRVDVTLRPVRTTQDLLRNVPGVFIAQHAGGGKARQLFLRGFDLDHGTDIPSAWMGCPSAWCRTPTGRAKPTGTSATPRAKTATTPNPATSTAR